MEEALFSIGATGKAKLVAFPLADAALSMQLGQANK
jgi:hypothetical protein